MPGLDVHTLCTGIQEAMAEILALQDFLDYVISVHPGGVNSFQLVLHRVLLYWMSREEETNKFNIAITCTDDVKKKLKTDFKTGENTKI